MLVVVGAGAAAVSSLRRCERGGSDKKSVMSFQSKIDISRSAWLFESLVISVATGPQWYEQSFSIQI